MSNTKPFSGSSCNIFGVIKSILDNFLIFKCSASPSLLLVWLVLLIVLVLFRLLGILRFSLPLRLVWIEYFCKIFGKYRYFLLIDVVSVELRIGAEMIFGFSVTQSLSHFSRNRFE